jgi:hypothetical protein
MMNEDETTLSVVHRFGEAISYACDRRYVSVIGCLIEAKEWLEILRDKYELALDEEDGN